MKRQVNAVLSCSILAADFATITTEFVRGSSARQAFFESFSRIAMQMVEEVAAKTSDLARRPPSPHNAHRWLMHPSSVLASAHAASRTSLGFGAHGGTPTDTTAQFIRVFRRPEGTCWMRLVLGNAPGSRTKITPLVASHPRRWSRDGVVRPRYAPPGRRASVLS